MDDAAKPAKPELVLRDDGALLADGMAIGRYDPAGARLTLNLGWCRLAGIGVTVQDDPEVDHHRGGIVLER